ncbi:ABC transporter permease [Candidatus Saccharibacteria bacterium]|nr:ABC transporter permease [Candidatus Saccharibacteria bacterium]
MGIVKRVNSKKNRALLLQLVKTDFKLRYQGSVVGYLWSLLRPLFMFLILYVVFTTVFPLGRGVPHYPVYLFVGIILWNFFAEMTQQSLGSIVGRGDLIRKIRIPRWMVVFSTSLNALINLGLNLVVLMVFMALNHVAPLATLLWLPLIVIEVYIFGLGISFFLAALFVKYRDIQYVWELILQAGFYLTPILYPLTRIENPTFQKILFMNPMAQAIQDARYALVSHDNAIVTIWRAFDGGWYALFPFAVVIALFCVGITYFRNQQNSFAENL